MFVDRIKVVAKAGDGGRGCVSFRREKFVPRGGPDGGDGGKGGDVILRADEHTDNLASLFYEPLIKAKKGEHGMGKQMHGRGAPAKIVKVPVGTVVWEATADETRGPDSEMEPLADLVRPNEEYILCQGGKGGKGNVHFKSSRNRAPRQYSEGEDGRGRHVHLRAAHDRGCRPGRLSERGQIHSAPPNLGRASEGGGLSLHDPASHDRGGGFPRLSPRDGGGHSRD